MFVVILFEAGISLAFFLMRAFISFKRMRFFSNKNQKRAFAKSKKKNNSARLKKDASEIPGLDLFFIRNLYVKSIVLIV